MCSFKMKFFTMTYIHKFALLSVMTLLLACSESQPDGHVYHMNSAGMILPAAGIEIAFVPGQSRAEFFYEPLKEAYLFATANLDQELVPVCNQAKTLLTKLQRLNSDMLGELQSSGNLPVTPDGCLNMCTQRINLEEQRLEDRQQLGKTIARLNAEIVNAQEKIKTLQDSRSKKAGELGRQLAKLESLRLKELSLRAEKLLEEQTGKIKFSIDGEIRYRSLYGGERVRVTLINDSDYAIVATGYEDRPLLEGYYRGEKIVEQRVKLPRYGEQTSKMDEFGFDLGYLVPPGGRVIIGDDSIGDFAGLSVSSPQGRLMTREKGWTANRKGYILPDEIRIKQFPAKLFVIPDSEGTRSGSTIFYNPKKVDFKDEVTSKGLPQDAEIARLKQKIYKQPYPEDAQISELNKQIVSLKKQKKQARVNYDNSAIATQITQLTDSERSCRTARDSLVEIDRQNKKLSIIEANLSSCGSELLEPAAVLAGVTELNSSYGAELTIPDTSNRYTAKALALVMSKLNKSIESTTLAGINGDYSILNGVDPDTHIALATWESGIQEGFWFQPLVSLGAKKDLSYSTAENGSFEDYIEKVIWYGAGVNSISELSLRLIGMGEQETSPFALKRKYESLAESTSENLLSLESEGAEDISLDGETDPKVSLTCEP